VAALEEKLQAVTDSLNEASKKQAETALELSLLKLEKEQMAASMETELQTAEETINALEKEISRLDDVDEQVVAFQKEKSVWEKDRTELEVRRQEVETLERRLEILEERSGEATEMERIIDIRDQEIARLKEEWEAERANWEIDRSSGATAQLDDVHATLRTLVRDHGVELRSQNPSSLSELVDSISSHLNGFYEEREDLERKVRNCIAEQEGLAQAFENARGELEGSRQEIRDLEAQSRVCSVILHNLLLTFYMQEQSDKIAELVAEQSSASLPPVEYRGDASDIVALLMPIWKVLPSAEARGAKLGQSRFKSPSSNAGTGNPIKPSLSEMDVRGLKTLYDAGKPDALQGSAMFVIDKFVSRVQALITDNHALIERLIQFTQAHDLLKKNVERAHKLASDSNAALETYQKQVKVLEERDISLSTKHAALFVSMSCRRLLGLIML
jgi:predicted nuclease with TOPRIM domain